MKNVLLVVVDDASQREFPSLYSNVWSYGPSLQPDTPNIDALAASGAVLYGVHSSANCSPSRVSLQTARYPHRYDIGDIITAGSAGLPVVTDSVPETFRALSYATGLFGKWHLTPPGSPPSAPLQHGWDVYYAGTHGSNFQQSGHYNWTRNDNGSLSIEPEWATLAQCKAAARWISEQTGRWYAQVNVSAPHAPWDEPPQELLTNFAGVPLETDRYRYAAAIEAMDTALGELLPVDLGDTVVVVVGDNGTPAPVAHPLQDSAKVKKTLYREGIEVPCVVGGFDQVYDGPMSLPRLMCDVYEEALCGEEMPPLTWDTVMQPVGQVYVERFTPNGVGPYVERSQIVNNGEWKLWREDGSPATDVLYHLAVDPEENSPIVPQPGDPVYLSLKAYLEGEE